MHKADGSLFSHRGFYVLDTTHEEAVDNMVRKLYSELKKQGWDIVAREELGPDVYVLACHTVGNARYVIGLVDGGRLSNDGFQPRTLAQYNHLEGFAIREARKHPWVLSTTRHISQGGVSLLDEQWDADTKTLSGKSAVVTNDPYAMTVHLPDGFRLTAATVDGQKVEIAGLQRNRHGPHRSIGHQNIAVEDDLRPMKLS